jgi:hypothetical protein
MVQILEEYKKKIYQKKDFSQTRGESWHVEYHPETDQFSIEFGNRMLIKFQTEKDMKAFMLWRLEKIKEFDL